MRTAQGLVSRLLSSGPGARKHKGLRTWVSSSFAMKWDKVPGTAFGLPYFSQFGGLTLNKSLASNFLCFCLLFFIFPPHQQLHVKMPVFYYTWTLVFGLLSVPPSSCTSLSTPVLLHMIIQEESLYVSCEAIRMLWPDSDGCVYLNHSNPDLQIRHTQLRVYFWNISESCVTSS